MTAPAYQALGTSAAATAAAVTPNLPSHAAGDLLVLVAEGSNTDFGSPPWDAAVEVSGLNSKLLVRTKIAASAAESDPTITPTSADHTYAQIVTFRNVHQRFPYQVIPAFHGGTGTVAGSVGAHPLFDDTLIAQIVAYGVDSAGPIASSEANSSITVTERQDAGTALGNGGGLIVYTGSKAAAGIVEPTSWTSGSSTAIACATLVIAPIADIPITVAVEVDGVPHASGDGVVFLYDTSQPQASYLVLDAATETVEYVDGLDGSGEADFVVPYNDHVYVAFYTDDSGGLSGVSGPITYSGGFPTAVIEISTGGGGGGGSIGPHFATPGVLRKLADTGGGGA